MKPHKRYSYWVLILIAACAGIPEVLPSIKESLPGWAFVALSLIGLVAQHIKQDSGEQNVEQVHQDGDQR